MNRDDIAIYNSTIIDSAYLDDIAYVKLMEVRTIEDKLLYMVSIQSMMLRGKPHIKEFSELDDAVDFYDRSTRGFKTLINAFDRLVDAPPVNSFYDMFV